VKRSTLTTAYATGTKGFVGAVVAVFLMGFSHRSTAKTMQAISESYSISLRAAMGRERVDTGAVPRERMTLQMIMAIAPEYRTVQEDIRVKEHQLMIEGHQYECEICIENAKPLRQKALEAMLKKWHS
jgi:hypothetical protein